MLRRLARPAGMALALAGAALLVPLIRGASRHEAQAAPAAGPRLLLVATPRSADATRSEVRFVAPGGAVQPLGALEHGAGAVLRGDVLPGREAAVLVADAPSPRPSDFDGVLWLVVGGGARVLAPGRVHASRPLASRDGWIYTEAGAAGPPPAPEDGPGALRLDTLALEAIQPDGTARRRLYERRALALHLAGEVAEGLVVYAVGREGAELLVVPRSGGPPRSLGAVAPFARDFVVDEAAGTVAFHQRQGAGYVVETRSLGGASLGGAARHPLLSGIPLPRRAHPAGGGLDGEATAGVGLAQRGGWLAVLRLETGPVRAPEVVLVGPGAPEPWPLDSEAERVEVLGFEGGGVVVR